MRSNTEVVVTRRGGNIGGGSSTLIRQQTAVLKASDWLNGQLSSPLNATRFPRDSLHGIPCMH